MREPQMDEKFYELHDCAKAGSSDCRGCSACCRNMGDSIRLDPMDVFELQIATGFSFDELMKKHLKLTIVNGMIIPALNMDEKTDACTFLKNDRCSIHLNRPGLCRLFPLGRNYDNGKMNYLLLKDTCDREMTKVKVSKWIGKDHAEQYHQYVVDWHYFAKNCQDILQSMENEETAKSVNLYLFHQFFQKNYDLSVDFYDQFYERLNMIQDAMFQE